MSSLQTTVWNVCSSIISSQTVSTISNIIWSQITVIWPAAATKKWRNLMSAAVKVAQKQQPACQLLKSVHRDIVFSIIHLNRWGVPSHFIFINVVHAQRHSHARHAHAYWHCQTGSDICSYSCLPELTDKARLCGAIFIVPLLSFSEHMLNTMLLIPQVVGFSLLPVGEGRWLVWRVPHEGAFLCRVAHPQPDVFIAACVTGSMNHGLEERVDSLCMHLGQVTSLGPTCLLNRNTLLCRKTETCAG